MTLVLEAGFIMEDEKLQLLIGLFGELKKDINDVKTELKTNINGVKMDIRAVAIGQDDLKTEPKNDISAVTDYISALETNMKGDISALETKINAGQKELRREISVSQERIRNIETGQAAFEEWVTCTSRHTVEEHVVHGRAADAQPT
jgi:hypothetical protein